MPNPPAPFNPATNARIATDLNDFKSHIEGTGFKQNAASINTEPGIEGATDLQTSLNNLNTFINASIEGGVGYISVPRDGYNSYTFPSPNFYFNNAIPSLDSFLNPIFTDILTNVALPSAYARIQNGGIVLIPAGTYYVVNPITVPPGITLLGEGYGTKIVNAIRLNLASSPPTLNSGITPQPVFIIAADTNRSNNDAAVDPNTFMFGRATQFLNLTICDNFVEPTLLGDLNYVLPQNDGSHSTPTVGLIQQNQGSNFVLENVNLVGRVRFSSGTVVSSATQFAISLDTTLPITTGTYLKISNCIIDGFSQPVNFRSKGGCFDYLEISNSKVRAHGYLNGDGSNSGNHAENNCIVAMNDNNAKIISNDLFGNHQACNTILSILGTLASAPNLDSISKINISSNTFIIDRGDTVSITPIPFYIDSAITTIENYATIVAFGNTYDETTGFEVIVGKGSAGTAQLFVTPTNTAIPNYITIGSTGLPSSGDMRVGTDFHMRGFNGASDITLITTDGAGNVYIGSDSDETSHLAGTVNIYPSNAFGQGISDTTYLNMTSAAQQVQIYGNTTLGLGSGIVTTAKNSGRIRAGANEVILAARNFADTADLDIIATNNSSEILLGDTTNTVATIINASNTVALEPGSAFFEMQYNGVALLSQSTPSVSGTSYSQIWSDNKSRLHFMDNQSNNFQGGVISLVLASGNNESTSLLLTNLTFNINPFDVFIVLANVLCQGTASAGVNLGWNVPTGCGVVGSWQGATTSANSYENPTIANGTGSETQTTTFGNGTPRFAQGSFYFNAGSTGGAITLTTTPSSAGQLVGILVGSNLVAIQAIGV